MKPTKAQRAAFVKALLLKKHCEAIGVEWDPEILRDDDSLDERRYTLLLFKMGETLFAKLGVRLGTRSGGDDQTEIWFRVGLDHSVTIDELIDLGKRAGWI